MWKVIVISSCICLLVNGNHGSESNSHLSFASFYLHYQILPPQSLEIHFPLTFCVENSDHRIIWMRRSSSSEIDDNGSGNAVPGTHSIRDRFPFKRNSSHFRLRAKDSLDHAASRSRSHQSRINRKGLLWWIPARGQTLFYFVVVFAVFGFVTGSMLLQSSISLMSSGSEKERWLMERIKFGSSLKFVPGRISRRLVEGDGLDELRKMDRIGVRAPRLALVSSSSFFISIWNYLRSSYWLAIST